MNAPLGAEARPRRLLFRLAMTCFLLTVSLAGGAGHPTGLAASAQWSALPGLVPAGIRQRSWKLVSLLPAGTSMRAAIMLAPRDGLGFQAAVQAVNDPSSPRYHHFLSPGAIARRFGPNAASVNDLLGWLRGEGLRAEARPGGLVVNAEGTVSGFAQAFRVSLARYALPSSAGRGPGTIYAPTGDPLLPSRFRGLVQSVVGLQGFDASLSRSAAASSAARGPSSGYAPAQVADVYNFRSLYAAGYHGERIRVALLELSPYDPADIAAYAAWAGVTPHPHDLAVDGGNDGQRADVEATMDIELLSALAPRAQLDVYDAPNDSTGVSLVDAYSDIYSAGTAQVVSLTWTTCEARARQIPGLAAAEHAIFAGLSLEGTTVVSAVGDTGAYACATPASAGSPAVNLPASDPYALAVGATDLTIKTTIAKGQLRSRLGTERAWSCDARLSPGCAALSPRGVGTGGGASSLFFTGDSYGDNLGWQAIVPAPNTQAGRARRLPDVAFSGSSSTPQREFAIYWQGQWTFGGGTSASAPGWAALLALVDEYLEGHNRPVAGWINPLVYRIGGTPQRYPAFHDVIAGNNLLQNAAAGWDFASGWGTPDAYSFALDVGCANGLCQPGARIPTATATAAAKPRSTLAATARVVATPKADPARTP
jgi:subtilase family serine protease